MVVDRDELTIFVDREALPAVAQAMRDDPDLRFESRLGVTGCTGPATPDGNFTRSTSCGP